VVIATGGLGPTADDLTREALAAATSRGLARDESIVGGLRARFARYARPMSDTNLQQADVIEGAEVLPNARGSAPGQLLEHAGKVAVLLPGPPGEMKPMFDEQVLPRLRAPRRRDARREAARAADRRHVRERRRRGGGSHLLALREPEDHDPGRRPARSSCTSWPTATASARSRSASTSSRGCCTRRCRAASSATTGASCRAS
jgi:hypothetical protein